MAANDTRTGHNERRGAYLRVPDAECTFAVSSPNVLGIRGEMGSHNGLVVATQFAIEYSRCLDTKEVRSSEEGW